MTPVLVFDLDDTLYPEREYVRSGFDAVGKWLFENQGTRGFFEEAWKLFEIGSRGNTFNLALETLGLVPAPELIHKMVDVYRNHLPRISLFPDAAEALEKYWKTHRLALLTDGYASSQRRKIEALGISRYFETLVVTDELGREFWKPHPRAYEEVTTRLRCRPDECTYIGDNPRKDFVTARKLGWKTVQIRRPLGEYSAFTEDSSFNADRIIDSLYQFAP